jgi:hypothetical protein
VFNDYYQQKFNFIGLKVDNFQGWPGDEFAAFRRMDKVRTGA